MSTGGKVFLVGAGPGDPGLLTLRGKELIECAEAIVYDRLVSREILAFASPQARLVYVGKRSGAHSLPQAEINAMLIRLARNYRRVVRLKGGDPLIFGRGGEEAEELARHGIAFEIVPGITSAQGAAASLALPLTLRGVNTSLRYVTGHVREDASLGAQDWHGLADPDTTLVIYMGAATIGELTRRLIEHGRAPSTPALAVSNATTDKQSTLRSTLGAIAADAEAVAFDGPVLFFIGEMVDHALHLADFERENDARPLLAALGLDIAV